MLKKYFPFFRASLLNIFIYRGRIILWVLVDIFRFVMMLFLWISVYKNNGSLNGFGLDEILLYFSLIGITSVFTYSEVQYEMSYEIRKGTLSYYLVKPIKYKTRLFFENLGSLFGSTVIVFPISILTMVILMAVFDVSFTVTLPQVLFFLAYLPLILVFVFEYGFFFGNLMVYTENNFGLSILMGVLMRALSGTLIPLAFYPDFLLKVVNFLPFRYVTQPVLIMLGKVDQGQIWLGLLTFVGWIVLFKLINYIIFKISVKRMVIFGDNYEKVLKYLFLFYQTVLKRADYLPHRFFGRDARLFA